MNNLTNGDSSSVRYITQNSENPWKIPRGKSTTRYFICIKRVDSININIKLQ